MKIRGGDVISDKKYKCSPRMTNKGGPKNFFIYIEMNKKGKEEICGKLEEGKTKSKASK